jgi:basic membrane protein A
MKRIISILLVLVLALSVVACGEKKTETTKAETAAADEAGKETEAPEAEEPKEDAEEPKEDAEEPKEDAKAPAEGGPVTKENLKIAMLLPGVINDGGWNAMAHAALMAAKEEYGAEVNFTENVSQNDQLRIARQYAEEGYNVIIGHGFEFGDSLTEAADEYPDIYFLNYGGGVKNGANLGSVQYAYGECGALAGVLIGMHPDIKKVGVIMAFDNPTGKQEMVNAEKTAKEYNPDVEFTYSFTGDWNDIAKAKEQATTALNQGADLILSDLSGPFDGMIQAVQEADKMFYVVTFDGYDKDPEHILGSSVHDATKATLAAIQLVLDGDFEGDIFRFGIKSGVMSMGKYGPSVTPEMEEEVEKLKEKIVAGEYELEILLED